jgi:hypothetical protein
VGHDHDRVARAAGAGGIDVGERDPPPASDPRLEAVGLDTWKPELRQPVGDPLSGGGRLRGPGRAIRERPGEVRCDLPGGDSVEGRRQLRRPQRLRSRHREGGREQRDPDQQPRAPVHPSVDGAIERAAARPAPF